MRYALLVVIVAALAQGQTTCVNCGGSSGNATQIQGRNVAATAPSDTNVMCWSAGGSTWGPCASVGGSAFTGSIATASAGITGTTSTPIFSLSDQSVKSPVRFEYAITASTAVTGITINNKTAGAKFSIVWTQPATNMAAVTVGAAIAETPCAVSLVANAWTEQTFEVASDGTTVHVVGCSTSDTSYWVPATPLVTPGTSITLAGPRGYAVCTATCTVAVPVPVAGYEFCVMNDDNVATAITLSGLGSSAMYENSARTAYGTAGTGTLVLSAAAANKVCVLGRDATHYFTVSYNGTVTVN